MSKKNNMWAIFNFIKYNIYIRRIIRDEKILDKLKYLFGGKEFKLDWICRIYAVVNPNVDNISSDGNILIYDDGRPVIEKWIMDNLNIMFKFTTSNNLFDILTYKIEKLDDDDNYLIIFQNIFYDSAKKSMKWLMSGCLLALILLITMIAIF